MCFEIKAEKKQNPHLFHYISNLRPGSLGFSISDKEEFKYGLDRRSNLRNEKTRDKNKWWCTPSLRTKNLDDKKKRWLLLPPSSLDATDITDYCEKGEEEDFRDLFKMIELTNQKLERENNIKYKILTEGTQEDILHIRFEPPEQK